MLIFSLCQGLGRKALRRTTAICAINQMRQVHSWQLKAIGNFLLYLSRHR